MTRFRAITLMLCLSAAPLAAQQTTMAVPTAPDSSTAENDASNPRALTLSLDEAIRTAARQNLGVDIQRYDYRATGWAAKGTYGIFDPLATADISTSSRKQPVTSVLVSPKSDQRIADFGLSQTLPTGGSYSVGFTNSRSESNNQFTTINPAYDTGLNFGLNQPLLRNFGVDVTRRGIDIARNTLGISREEFRNVMTDTALAVERAYLDLIYARRNLGVVQQSRELATEQERITRIRIDVGASAPLDILQPRVAIATREEQVISAQAAVRNAEDRLRQLMNLPPSEWDRPIIPTDELRFDTVSFNAEEAVRTAFARRPEIEQARLGTDTRRIQHMYARNQVLPRVDLKVNYGIAGVGGDQTTTDPTTGVRTVRTGGYNDALSQVGGFDFPSWTVGVSVGIPLRNITARSEAKRTELELDRSRVSEEQVRQSIAVEVRQTIRNLDTAARQITATRAAREAAEQNVDAERKRFQNGMTTNFNVLQIQQELSDARIRENAAIVAYNQSLADYHRAVGDLLETRGITVDVPEEFDLPHSRFERNNWFNYSGWSHADDETTTAAATAEQKK